LVQQGNRTTACFFKDKYPAEPWIVLHGWPIEPHVSVNLVSILILKHRHGHWLSLIADCSNGSDCPTISPDCELCGCISQALTWVLLIQLLS